MTGDEIHSIHPGLPAWGQMKERKGFPSVLTALESLLENDGTRP